jgi:hypothetical protein
MQAITITIPNYIREVVLAEKIRARYWKPGMDFPKECIKSEYLDQPETWQDPKVLKERFYIKDHFAKNKDTGFFETFTHLVYWSLDTDKLERVIVNPKKVGKKRIMKISGQAIYAGLDSPFTRTKITTQIKESFLPYVSSLPVIDDYPLSLTFTILDAIEKGRWDLDNRIWLYVKCFNDLMTTGKTGKLDKNNIPIKYFEPKFRDDDRLSIAEIHLQYRPSDNRQLNILIAPVSKTTKDWFEQFISALKSIVKTTTKTHNQILW